MSSSERNKNYWSNSSNRRCGTIFIFAAACCCYILQFHTFPLNDWSKNKKIMTYSSPSNRLALVAASDATSFKDVKVTTEYAVNYQSNYDNSRDSSSSSSSSCLDDYQRMSATRIEGLTTEDLLRSKAYSGSRYQLAKLYQKLQKSEEPVQAVVAGGSISVGHGVVKNLIYSNRLETWFNDNFPLKDQNKKHTVFNRGSHGADICSMSKRLNLLMKNDLPPEVDLFVLEFAVNDYQGQDHEHMVIHKTDVFFEGLDQIALCTEAVIVKLLRHYPDAAIVFLEMRGAKMERKTASFVHMGVAQHYQIPVISYEQAVFPDYHYIVEALKPYNYSTAINDMVLPYPHGCHSCIPEHIVEGEMFRDSGCKSLCDLQSQAAHHHPSCHPDTLIGSGREPCYLPFFAHDNVHPSGIGHQIAADLLIDMIARTGRDLCEQKQTQPSSSALLLRKPVFPSVGWMVNNPETLDAQTDFLLVNDTYRILMEPMMLEASVHTKGFNLRNDKFNRKGWMAYNHAGNEQVVFDIQLPERGCYIPYLSVLKSYENMGQMIITVLDKNTNIQTTTETDSLWTSPISVPVDVQLIDDYAQIIGCSGNCQVIVTTKPIVQGRKSNLVKIITLAVRQCVREETSQIPQIQ